MKHRYLTRRDKRIAEIPHNKEQARLILAGHAPIIYPLVAIENGRPVFAVKIRHIREIHPASELWFRCPICNGINTHNISNRYKPGSGDGERCSGCPCWNGIGYIIRQTRS